jgi:hypothetical protein
MKISLTTWQSYLYTSDGGLATMNQQQARQVYQDIYNSYSLLCEQREDSLPTPVLEVKKRLMLTLAELAQQLNGEV